MSVDSHLPKYSDLIDDIKAKLGDINENNSLIIAEMFYHQFGENQYYEYLKKQIPAQALPNALHKEIVKLNLKNLISTNWDDLFERAIDDEGQFFNIIKSDDELAYTTGFSRFIKMHGSLEKFNIVFREKDYLEYSFHFALIENYIKGIFSTDVVVMLGYSLSDYNVKQIISWVNYHSDNIKPIYFVKCIDNDEELNFLEYEFYKKKNIYILYLCDRADIHSLSDKGKILYKFLEKISAKMRI